MKYQRRKQKKSRTIIISPQSIALESSALKDDTDMSYGSDDGDGQDYAGLEHFLNRRVHPRKGTSKKLFPAHATEIEVIPCKVCSDKSSGVHYGVITCEGCKGFFRRSQSNSANYNCQKDGKCQIDRQSRNRCQYCRLQKCLALGMSKEAVKFGRMSKRQREMVQDEVKYHKRVRSNSSDSGSDTDMSITELENNNLVNEEILANQIYALTTQVYREDDNDSLANLLLQVQRKAFYGDELLDLLTSVDELRLHNSSSFWEIFALKMTPTIQQIIEFAKLTPGFTALSQDDQIMVLKGAGYEMVMMHLLWTCSVLGFKLSTADEMGLDILINLSAEERSLIRSTIDVLKHLSSLKLTEREIALLNTVVLFQPDHYGVEHTFELKELHDKHMTAFTELINRTHESMDYAEKALSYLPYLKALANQHLKALTSYKISCDGKTEFPALYRELFAITDITVSS